MHNEQQLIIALWAIMFTIETTELVVWRERELNEILAYKKKKTAIQVQDRYIGFTIIHQRFPK